MSLNAIKVENLRAKKADYRVADGGGLYLLVRSNESKLWRYDYRLAEHVTNNVVRRTFSIGAYGADGDGVRTFSLKQAREEHEAARAAVARGEHPVSPAQRAAKANAKVDASGMSRCSTSVKNFGSTHVALGALICFVGFDFGLTTVSKSCLPSFRGKALRRR